MSQPDLVVRPYAHADLAAVVDLFFACRAARRLDEWTTARDLRAMIAAEPGPERATRLWEGGGRLIAVAMLRWPAYPLVMIHRNARVADVAPPIVDWIAERTAIIARDRGQSPRLSLWVRDEDHEFVAFLDQSGFAREDLYTMLLHRSLDDPIPEPHLPPGFTIRPVAGEAEVEDYVALHRDAFGTKHMTVEHRREIMRHPDHVPDMDLVVVAPDGTLAAFCVGQIEPEMNLRLGQRHGWTDPLGTRPAFRRMGLQRVLLLTHFQRLKSRGLDTAKLGTGSWNEPAQRLFASVGFRRAYKMIRFVTALSNGR